MKQFHAFLLVFLSIVRFSEAGAHPYHVSIAEVKYNARTQALEIAMKIFTDDLQETLSRSAQKPVILKQDPASRKQLETYLEKKIQLEAGTQKVYPQRFLGYETEGDAQWLYFEIPVKAEELKKAKIRNQVLLEMHADQMNLMNFELNKQKRTLIFKDGAVLQSLY